MVELPKFDKRDTDKIHEYLHGWEEHGIGDLPDFSTDALRLVPLTLALLKNAEDSKKLLEQILLELKAIPR